MDDLKLRPKVAHRPSGSMLLRPEVASLRIVLDIGQSVRLRVRQSISERSSLYRGERTRPQRGAAVTGEQRGAGSGVMPIGGVLGSPSVQDHG
jgi:hypothetical protein